MEAVVIRGGVVQDMTKGVTVIDLDNLAEEKEIEVLVSVWDTAANAGMNWVANVIVALINKQVADMQVETGLTDEEIADYCDSLGFTWGGASR